jgi:hypothetical protein
MTYALVFMAGFIFAFVLAHVLYAILEKEDV